MPFTLHNGRFVRSLRLWLLVMATGVSLLFCYAYVCIMIQDTALIRRVKSFTLISKICTTFLTDLIIQ